MALTLGALSTVARGDHLQAAYGFLINEALLDPSDDVRQQLVQAGLDLMSEQPAEVSVNLLLPIFEKYACPLSLSLSLFLSRLFLLLHCHLRRTRIQD